MSRDADPKTDPHSSTSRTVERNIKKGLITRKDYEKHLKALEDVGRTRALYGGPKARTTTTTSAEAAAERKRRRR